jgi:hypothetical protein
MGLLVWILLFFLLFLIHICAGSSGSSSCSCSSRDLEKQIRELAKIAWATEEAYRDPNFFLSTSAVSNETSHEQTVAILLNHARRVAPGFIIPHMVPRILSESEETRAGYFEVDRAGWVKISINSKFLKYQSATQAILAHEVCHYILENSGIRKANKNLNERYTDLCMFVMGFGEVYLARYKRESTQHKYRIGYLNDNEYEHAQRYVKHLRRSCEVAPPSELVTLKQRLWQLTRDRDLCERMIKATRQRFPGKSELELYRWEIDRFELLAFTLIAPVASLSER